ncbi:MAG TPA: undecaprenyl-diphosphate phosphatase [Candidatus Obscuribacterales bacterium]
MKWHQSLILGAVQGLTEFLPVSSTAHLNLVRQACKWQSPGMVLDTSLHLGTLLATFGWLLDEERRHPLLSLPLVAKVGIATVPAGLAGLFLERWIEQRLRSPQLISAMLIFGAGLLWWAEREAVQANGLEELSLAQAGLIGLAQMLALVPGVSRSGITMTAGLLTGLTRQAAVRFSFLLSVPVVAASGLFKLKDLAGQPRQRDLIGTLLIGGLSAAGCGWLTLEWLLKYVGRHSLRPFVFHRLLLGGLLLVAGRGSRSGA